MSVMYCRLEAWFDNHDGKGVGVKRNALSRCSSSTSSICALSNRGATQSRIQAKAGTCMLAKKYLSRFYPKISLLGYLKWFSQKLAIYFKFFRFGGRLWFVWP